MKCHPIIETINSDGPTGGHTTDDVRPDGSLGMRPRIVINATGLSERHRAQLLAHEMVHARWACAEAQGAARPHVGVEEVQAYWEGGSCDAGGYHRGDHGLEARATLEGRAARDHALEGRATREAHAAKCGCVESHAVESCRMAGLSDDECRRVVREVIARGPYHCP